MIKINIIHNYISIYEVVFRLYNDEIQSFRLYCDYIIYKLKQVSKDSYACTFVTLQHQFSNRIFYNYINIINLYTQVYTYIIISTSTAAHCLIIIIYRLTINLHPSLFSLSSTHILYLITKHHSIYTVWPIHKRDLLNEYNLNAVALYIFNIYTNMVTSRRLLFMSSYLQRFTFMSINTRGDLLPIGFMQMPIGHVHTLSHFPSTSSSFFFSPSSPCLVIYYTSCYRRSFLALANSGN